MHERLRKLLEELESIDYYIQGGCIDLFRLSCFKDCDNEEVEPDFLMAESDRLTGIAFSAIDELMEMMKEEE